MTPEEWNNIQNAFQHAIDLNAAARERYLEQLNLDDPSLYTVVQAMLVEDGDSSDVLMQPVTSAAESFTRSARDKRAGQLFGNFRAVSKIASGGMSAVYLGKRDDDQYDQDVAIKIVAGNFQSEELLDRFRTEQQILAKLEHPNIARILDGGTTDDGVAYLVMEYVEGVPLDRFCQEQRLSIGDRLGLFQAVCNAVEFAHQNLIVHRDIKPSNILVTADGMPKLLDFGIAKLLQEDGDNVDVEATEINSRAMTPDFASPEQVLGQTITTSSDVYSLGVLLFLLLSGQRPYSTAGLTLGERERTICEVLPPRPSNVVGTAGNTGLPGLGRKALARRLRGDLDDIVLQALNKEPDKRYASVYQFAADIRRHRSGMPISARGRTWGYVFGKFLYRNVLPVTAAVVVLTVGTIAAVYHNQTITAERDRAQAEARKSATVAQFLTDVFRLSDPDETQGATVTAKEILDVGVARLDEDLGAQPDIRASLSLTIGGVYNTLGLYPEAASQYETALALGEELGDPAGMAAALAGLHEVLFEQGELDRSHEAAERSLTISRSYLPADHVDIAVRLNNLGHAKYARGEYDAAVETYYDALHMFERLDARNHVSYPDTLHDIGQIMQLQGDVEDAEPFMRTALDYATENYGELYSITATYMHDYAALLHELNRFTESESYYLRVLDLEAELMGETYPHRDATLTNLGRLYTDMNRFDDAEDYLQRAVEASIAVRGERHTFTAYDMNNLANLLTMKGEYDRARPIFESTLAIYAENLEETHPYIASASVGYAALLNLTGLPQEGQSNAQHALEICRASLPEDHWLASSATSILGESLMLQGQLDEAEALLLSGYEGVSEARPRDRITVNALKRLVRFYELRNDPDGAATYREYLDAVR